MWVELLVAFLLIVGTFVIHGLGTFSLSRWILPAVQSIHSLAFTAALWLMLRFFLVLVALHLLESAVWAEFYFMQHCFPDRETAYYFSLQSYTTLGYGDVAISRPWRLMGTLEAMSGVLLFGWSTAMLISLLSRLREVRRESSLADHPL
ncbi:MAG: ion channel [Candidatus Sulfotelmatobacter sp.]